MLLQQMNMQAPKPNKQALPQEYQSLPFAQQLINGNIEPHMASQIANQMAAAAAGGYPPPHEVLPNGVHPGGVHPGGVHPGQAMLPH